MKVGRGTKHTKTDLLFIFCVFSNGTSLDEGSFVVEHWLQEEQQLHLLEGVHRLLCGRPLVVRGSFTMSICRGKGSSDGRRNNSRKDGGNYREGQRITMKYVTEGRFISRDKHGDGLLYFRGNWFGWHQGWGR
jgi:hypothetical protein